MISVPILIAIIYGLMYSMMRPEEFGFKGLLDPFYFSFTTMSTVGYGDFTPKTDRAKALVMTQHAVIIVGVVTLVNFFISLR
jgi:voltage-gated potassium channel